MNDDFAASRGGSALSALSAGGDALVVDAPHAELPFDRLTDFPKEEDNDVSLPADPVSVLSFSGPRAAQPPEAIPTPSRAGLVVHLYRSPSDSIQIDPLLSGLKRLGWGVAQETQLIPRPAVERVEPTPAPSSDGQCHVLLGVGLGGTRAMWDSWYSKSGSVQGVVAVCPFLGFDAPMYRSGANGVGTLRQRAFDLAAKSLWRPVFSRVECVSSYVGLGRFADQAVSWTDLVEAAPFPGFGDLMSHPSCPTAIVLDVEDPDIDAERATTQIPAMNTQVAVSLCALSGEQLVVAVDEALFSLLRYFRGLGRPVAAPAPNLSYGMQAK